MTTIEPLHIIGAGLAGSEAAWQAARMGIPVILHEMRPTRMTEAHRTGDCAELVCSNSFRSDDPENNAVGLLHAEMRDLSSLIMACADAHKVPAGGALAVDREGFSAAVTEALRSHPLIEIVPGEIAGLPPESFGETIIATGPLTAPALGEAIRTLTGEDSLAFFDAIAPIVYRDSINMDIAWRQSRYDREDPTSGTGGDYINCPFDKEPYFAFVNALLEAGVTEFREWEKTTPYFEGCMPVEVMASRGPNTLRFGPMKPVGLKDPRAERRPYAVVQLRQDNALGTLYNMVGFQTKMKYADQVRVFRMIPGLENAEFARLGGMHRNTFLNSPRLLDKRLRLKAMPRLRFAGQITGCEGYVESASVGLLAGLMAASERLGAPIDTPPPNTAMGALLGHITGGGHAATFQPMNVNFGLFPPLPDLPKGSDRKQAMSARARAALARWIDAHPFLQEATGARAQATA